MGWPASGKVKTGDLGNILTKHLAIRYPVVCSTISGSTTADYSAFSISQGATCPRAQGLVAEAGCFPAQPSWPFLTALKHCDHRVWCVAVCGRGAHRLYGVFGCLSICTGSWVLAYCSWSNAHAVRPGTGISSSQPAWPKPKLG